MDTTTLGKPTPDDRFEDAKLPVAPFGLAPYVPVDQPSGDLVHEFYREQYRIDGGKMDPDRAATTPIMVGCGGPRPRHRIPSEGVN
jgi:hypothetical protein